jgi:hypothetical protein
MGSGREAMWAERLHLAFRHKNPREAIHPAFSVQLSWRIARR